MNDQLDVDLVAKRRLRLGKSQEEICLEFGLQRGWLSEVERNVYGTANWNNVSS